MDGGEGTLCMPHPGGSTLREIEFTGMALPGVENDAPCGIILRLFPPSQRAYNAKLI